VVEKRSKLGFESGKAYLYLIDKRGQRTTNLLEVTGAISARAVSSLLFPTLNEVLPDGVIKVQQLPVMDSSSNEKYWIPRSELLSCFTEQIEKNNINGTLANINLRYESTCDGFRVGDDGKVKVHISDGGGGQEVCPDLLVASDGISSAVRSWLETTDQAFVPVSLPSAAAGLKYKMLTLKHRFPLPQQAGAPEPLPSVPEQKYVFRSVSKALTSRVNLGLLSVKGGAKRTANIICVPQHKVWQLNTFADVKQFLVSSFPQIDFSTFVDDDEIARFAQSPAGEFPKPQYVQKMQTILPGQTGEPQQQQGIVLLGDSAHAFPPDLGKCRRLWV
jgi:2-polyprenyl-6-methoxyphenol hydroxylase-like FAD-dependent oxidoreductase